MWGVDIPVFLVSTPLMNELLRCNCKVSDCILLHGVPLPRYISTDLWNPFYWYGLILIPVRIYNHSHDKTWYRNYLPIPQNSFLCPHKRVLPLSVERHHINHKQLKWHGWILGPVSTNTDQKDRNVQTLKISQFVQVILSHITRRMCILVV